MSEDSEPISSLFVNSDEVAGDRDGEYVVEAIHWIQPDLPTVLDEQGLKELTLPATEMNFFSMDGVLIFPGQVSIAKLQSALARALQDYPHAAGRLRRVANNTFSIALTNSSIPLTIGIDKALDPGKLVLRDEPHEGLVETLRVTPDFVEGKGDDREECVEFDEPLVRFTMTKWEKTGEWSLGLAWMHVLGDALTGYAFANAVQHAYLSLPLPPAPTFEKYLTPVPRLERSLLYTSLPLVPYLAIDYAPEEFMSMWAEMNERSEPFQFQLSSEQVDQIWEKARMELTGTGVRMISKGDAVAGLLVKVMIEAGEKVERVVNWVNYRGVDAVPGKVYTPPSTLASGTTVISVSTEKFSNKDKGSLGALSALIRRTNRMGREPERVRRMVALEEELRARYLVTKRIPWYWTYEDSAWLNNLYKVPFTSLHFGYPGKARFHTFGSWERCIRIWPANPERGEDGVWRDNEGGMLIMLRLRSDIRERFDCVLREALRDLGEMKPARDSLSIGGVLTANARL